MSTICRGCFEELTPADEAEHKRRADLAQQWSNVILVDTTLCIGCIAKAQQNRGTARAVAIAGNTLSPWNESAPDLGE